MSLKESIRGKYQFNYANNIKSDTLTNMDENESGNIFSTRTITLKGVAAREN